MRAQQNCQPRSGNSALALAYKKESFICDYTLCQGFKYNFTRRTWRKL